MPRSERQPPAQRAASARERIAAKRATQPRRLFVPPVLLVAAIGVVAIVLLGGMLLNFRQTLGRIQQADPRRQQLAAGTAAAGGAAQPAVVAPGALDAPFNVLLIGVDKRPNADDGVRSDTLIAVHVDPQQKRAAMLSIPRDSVVQIPNFGQAKINTAYSDGYNNAARIYGPNTTADAGGGALAAETVEQFLGVKIDYLAQVDFSGFAQVVEALGGVVVDVERPLLDAEYPTADYGVERIYIPAGLQVMDGRTALVYARSRHSGDDFGRSKRQQQVLHALLEQVKARGLLENVAAFGDLTSVLTKNVRTTLPLQDPAALAGLAALAKDLSADHVAQLSVNPNDVQATIDGSDLYWNQADLEALVARWQGGGPAADTARVQVVNGASVEGVATGVSTLLRGNGFALVDPATTAQRYPNTLVVDYTGHPDVAKRLATTLGLDMQRVQSPPGPDAPPKPGAVDILVVVGSDFKPEWLSQH